MMLIIWSVLMRQLKTLSCDYFQRALRNSDYFALFTFEIARFILEIKMVLTGAPDMVLPKPMPRFSRP
jgi:hypothetical protein